MLTISFLVPDEMHEDVMQKIYKYIEILTATLGSRFAKQPFSIRAKECALAFVTLLDGLDVQLVYEDSQRYEELQAIVWISSGKVSVCDTGENSHSNQQIFH